jgi:aminopeptidase N
MLRAGMPVVEQRVDTRDGRITRLTLTQSSAVSACELRRVAEGPSSPPCRGGPAPDPPWTERTEVLLHYPDRPTVRLPVELRGASTDVAAAAGRPAPDFVFANARDYGYFLLQLDSASSRALEGGALDLVDDAFLRAMLWGTLWDQVRGFRMDPERFVQLALRELPRETDEQIVPVILARLDRVVGAYLRPEARDRVQPEVERVLLAGAADTARPYGVRKAYVDAFIGLAATAAGIARLDTLLSADSVAGEPLRDPTRWDAVSRLLELGAPTAEARYADQMRRDTTADGRRRSFMAGAGRPSRETKRTYFTRYFADRTLNEEWASGSLASFNALEQQPLSLPYMGPALDSLPYIQAHRRIFFLETWLAAFLRGQTGDSALRVVYAYLAGRPTLALDLRRKLLQQADELERTVRIRRAPPTR